MTHDNHNACCTNQNILLPSFVGHMQKKEKLSNSEKNLFCLGHTSHPTTTIY